MQFSENRFEEILPSLLQKMRLGTLAAPPDILTGGLMHRIYAVKTSIGNYAVKHLNPGVMKRPEAAGNIRLSEAIAERLSGTVPAVAALRFNGSQLIFHAENWFLIFPFCDGSPLFGNSLTEYHTGQVGELLGKIHSLNLQPDPDTSFLPFSCPVIDWERLVLDGRSRNMPWCGELDERKEALECWNRLAADAVEQLSAETLLSHRDLDPKNILWSGERPQIIDWEAAGPVNPDLEFLEALIHWCAESAAPLRKNCVRSMLNGYRKHRQMRRSDWAPVIHAGYSANLQWLAWNLQCSLVPSEERNLRLSQVAQTFRELSFYERYALELKPLLAISPMNWNN